MATPLRVNRPTFTSQANSLDCSDTYMRVMLLAFAARSPNSPSGLAVLGVRACKPPQLALVCRRKGSRLHGIRNDRPPVVNVYGVIHSGHSDEHNGANRCVGEYSVEGKIYRIHVEQSI